LWLLYDKKIKMENIEQIIERIHQEQSDINEHIVTLVEYASTCDHITEMGVRGVVSTWAFLAGFPKKLISYDIQDPSYWGSDIKKVYDTAKYNNVEYHFNKANVLDVEIEETDLLFIDTWHTYDQLSSELELHSHKVNKYIIIHDTTSFEYNDESTASENRWTNSRSGLSGLWPAIRQFLEEKEKYWALHERFTNNNGLTILKRKK